MSSIPNVQPSEFFRSFSRRFEELSQHQPQHMNSMFQTNPLWTQFMLKEFLPAVIADVRRGLSHRHEFKNIDLVAWDNVAVPWNGMDLNQTAYDQPLYVHLLIEHENGPYPNEEFWKLLHLYAPLKVLVCYPKQPRDFLDWISEVRSKVCDFHLRSPNDAYLVVIGKWDASTPTDLAWEGYEAR